MLTIEKYYRVHIRVFKFSSCNINLLGENKSSRKSDQEWIFNRNLGKRFSHQIGKGESLKILDGAVLVRDGRGQAAGHDDAKDLNTESFSFCSKRLVIWSHLEDGHDEHADEDGIQIAENGLQAANVRGSRVVGFGVAGGAGSKHGAARRGQGVIAKHFLPVLGALDSAAFQLKKWK
jgi:hypothetical protein